MSDKVFNIIRNVGGTLIAEHNPTSGHAFEYGILALGAILLIASFFLKSVRAALAGVLFLIIGAWSVSLPSYPSFRMTVDQHAGTIHTESARSGRVISSVTVSTPEIASAEMQFNRGDTRIVIIKKDGSLFFPLGEQYAQNQPDEYVALNSIRAMIGSEPQSAETGRR